MDNNLASRAATRILAAVVGIPLLTALLYYVFVYSLVTAMSGGAG